MIWVVSHRTSKADGHSFHEKRKRGAEIRLREILIPRFAVCILHAAKVRQFSVGDGLWQGTGVGFWDSPLPTFGVTISERKVTALGMAIGRYVPPGLYIPPAL